MGFLGGGNSGLGRGSGALYCSINQNAVVSAVGGFFAGTCSVSGEVFRVVRGLLLMVRAMCDVGAPEACGRLARHARVCGGEARRGGGRHLKPA